MEKWVKVLFALAEDPRLVPGTHMATHMEILVPRDPTPFSSLFRHCSYSIHVHIGKKTLHTHTHTQNLKDKAKQHLSSVLFLYNMTHALQQHLAANQVKTLSSMKHIS